jgi:hypothetical protein
MDLWWGHIGAVALFDWTQNPDVLALLASGLCATGRDHYYYCSNRKYLLGLSTDIPLGFATPHVNHMWVSCAHLPFRPSRVTPGPRPAPDQRRGKMSRHNFIRNLR